MKTVGAPILPLAVGVISEVDAAMPPELPEASTFQGDNGSGLRNRQDSEKEPLMKTDSIYWENLCQHESENLRTWLGMTWAEDCEAKPKLPWIDSASFKKAAREAFGIQDELDRSLKRFEFPGTTPHSRSTAL